MKKVLNFIRSLPGVEEALHFDKTAFKINTKIIATYDEEHNRFCVKLSETEQDVFCRANKETVSRVPNKWGKKGWTFFDAGTDINMLKEAILCAFRSLAPKKLVDQLTAKRKREQHS